jgi:hypothetical protein
VAPARPSRSIALAALGAFARLGARSLVFAPGDAVTLVTAKPHNL